MSKSRQRNVEVEDDDYYSDGSEGYSPSPSPDTQGYLYRANERDASLAVFIAQEQKVKAAAPANKTPNQLFFAPSPAPSPQPVAPKPKAQQSLLKKTLEKNDALQISKEEAEKEKERQKEPQEKEKGKEKEKEKEKETEDKRVEGEEEAKEAKEIKRKQVKQCSDSRRKEIEQKIKQQQADGISSHLNMIVVGHVDAGKSTTMGHLLYLLGNVSQKTMHKYENESKKIGKASFQYAWVLDEGQEERSRGVTIDIAINHFRTKSHTFTLLDAPGHKDFVPNMISGATQADVAVLVLAGSNGEFESGFVNDGQTKEHAVLIRSLGVTQLIVAVNKMDTVDWSEQRFQQVCKDMGSFLKANCGFAEKNITYVPCSGYSGDNLVPEKRKVLSWYGEAMPTLIEAIDKFRPAERTIDKALRLCITDVYKSPSFGLAILGKIDFGFVSVNDNILIMPINEVCLVKAIRVGGETAQYAFAGQNVELSITAPESTTTISVGNVICDPENPIPLVKRFRAQIVTIYALKVPITNGFQVVLHSQSYNEPAVIQKLVSIIDKNTGEVKKANPRCIGEKTTAIVNITTGRQVCLEQFSSYKQYGRIMLRDAGNTIAVGIVSEILS